MYVHPSILQHIPQPLVTRMLQVHVVAN